MSDAEHVPTEPANNEADKTKDSQVAAVIEGDDSLDDLDDVEFMLDEIENRIAPLA